MPRRGLRPCAYPGCRNLVRDGRYCTDHSRRVNVERGSAASRGYGARWRRLRLMFLHEHPLCALCGAPATEVDHIIPIRLGGSNDAANLQALCKPCHSTKTAREDGRWGVGDEKSERDGPGPVGGLCARLREIGAFGSGGAGGGAAAQ